MSINLFHWNPHWQCYVNKCCTVAESCPASVESYLNNILGTQNIDFASLLMYEMANYIPPYGYSTIKPYTPGKSDCGMDTTSIVYNYNNWTPISKTFVTCLQSNDRMAVLVKFKSNHSSLTLWVLAAHFGHNDGGFYDPIELNELNDFIKKSGVSNSDNFIMMADTNAGGISGKESNEIMLRTVLGYNSNVVASVPFKSCCYSDNFSWSSDRILSNFGSKMITHNIPPTSQTPEEWAYSINLPPSCYLKQCKNSPTIAEMHKPVLTSLILNNNTVENYSCNSIVEHDYSKKSYM